MPEMDETVNSRPMLAVNPALCIGCGHCMDRCPTGAVQVVGSAQIDQEKCIRCQTCAGRCPMGAIGRA